MVDRTQLGSLLSWYWAWYLKSAILQYLRQISLSLITVWICLKDKTIKQIAFTYIILKSLELSCANWCPKLSCANWWNLPKGSSKICQELILLKKKIVREDLGGLVVKTFKIFGPSVASANIPDSDPSNSGRAGCLKAPYWILQKRKRYLI